MLRILRHALRKHVRVQLMEQEGNSLSFLVAIDVSSIWLSLNASCVFLFGQTCFLCVFHPVQSRNGMERLRSEVQRRSNTV